MGNLEKNMAMSADVRADFALIAQWVSPNAKVLDLGCGDGSLLSQLRKTHHIRGYGVEKREQDIKGEVDLTHHQAEVTVYIPDNGRKGTN